MRFKQEYWVEIFRLPYLLSSEKQPKFAIVDNQTSFGYGEAITLNVKQYQGTASDIKVSMMGADSSTHGNSMGQRTIFPTVSCLGTTCNVTTPPNVHVRQPGWHQPFVLEGPTPSHSIWIRVAGDPAGLQLARLPRLHETWSLNVNWLWVWLRTTYMVAAVLFLITRSNSSSAFQWK